MKIIIPLCLLFYTSALFSQVGINTTNPQEMLHVAGSSSTIRIDGLNQVNNIKNEGGANLYNVKVDANGTLKLGTKTNVLLSVTNAMSPVVSVATTTTAGYNATQLYSRTFTLAQPSLVYITYTMSSEIQDFSGTSTVTDGRAKIIYNYYQLGNGTTTTSSKAYGAESMVYTNVNCDTASGYMLITNTSIQLLPAGTHSIHLMGAVYGGNTSTNAAFVAKFGNQERLEIIASEL